MKKKILFIILMFIIMPVFAKAASVSVALSCPTSANENSEIKCNVEVTSDVLITGLSSNYILKGLTYVDFEPKNDFAEYYSSASGFAVGNLSGKSGAFTIGVITLKVTAAGSVQLSNLDASDKDGNSYGTGAISNSISVRINSTNNSLASLTLSNGTLSPAFSKDITNYTATIDAPSVTINATKSDNYQKIMGIGTHNLNYGDNTFKISVTSESGSTKTYTIKITRPDKRSTNNYLKSLSLDNGQISFNKNTTNYSVNVDSNVTTVRIDASKEDEKASFIAGNGPRTVNLNYGNNEIIIKVIAENESVRTYTININRNDDRSKNNNLKSLTLSKGKIVFDKDTLEYNVSVNHNVDKIDVNALAEDEKSIIKVSNPELIVGDNVVTIEVVSENGQVKVYKINVKRLSEAEKMSDNNKVSKLNIIGQDFKFSNDVFEYKIKIGKDESELLFNIELEDEKSSYTIKNNKNLKSGSIVSLIVISESGIEKEYKFIVSKEKFGNVFWYIIICVISLIVGFFLGLIFSKFINKKDKDGKNNNDIDEPSKLNITENNAQNNLNQIEFNNNIATQYLNNEYQFNNNSEISQNQMSNNENSTLENNNYSEIQTNNSMIKSNEDTLVNFKTQNFVIESDKVDSDY